MTTHIPNKPKRRTYSSEFKELLVQEAESSGSSIASIARDHGINQNLIYNWKLQHHRRKTQISTQRSGSISLTITQIDPQSLIDLLRGLQ